MATIHSVVRVVDPGAPCSHPVGVHEVQFFYDPACAEWFRNKCNNARHESVRGTPGVRYEVQEVDEESPSRAPMSEARKKAHDARTAKKSAA